MGTNLPKVLKIKDVERRGFEEMGLKSYMP
jgi:hypothetical protein